MKLKLIYDYNTNDGMKNDDCTDEADENHGYCSDTYINSRNLHENMNYNETMRRQLGKYFKSKSRAENMHLVDIPDEIMLQYMLEGVYDFDWIAYDFDGFRVGISNTAFGALRYGEPRRYGRNGGVNSSTTNHFFEFGISSESEFDAKNNVREEYNLVPDGEHYNNIIEVLKPYVDFQFSRNFNMCSDVIRSTQDFEIPTTPSDLIASDEYWYEDQTIDNMLSMRRVFGDDESKCRQTWDMSYDAFLTCLKFWKEDHPTFLSSRQYLSDYAVESFRLMDERIKRKISGTY